MAIGAAGFLIKGDKTLLAKRSGDRRFFPGTWSFIGGHCEESERPAEALVREMSEEIGVKALVFDEIAVLKGLDPAEYGAVTMIHVYRVTAWSREPRILNCEHTELRWLDLDQALDLSFLRPEFSDLLRSALGEGEPRSKP